MLLRRHYRSLVATVCAVVALSLVFLSAGTTEFDGRLFDLALAVRAKVQLPPVTENPVVVIALDGKSLNSEELQSIPRVFFGPFWAKMLDGLFDAGARAVGFDIIFAYNANAFRIDHDARFLQALARYRDRVVLARSSDIDVALPYAIALDPDGDSERIAYTEIVPDSDLVYRRASKFVGGDGVSRKTLVPAVLERAGINAFPSEMLLASREAFEALPTYSFIDVLRCAAIDPEKLVDAVSGRVVFVGTNLPEEDRKIAADRFMPSAADSSVTDSSDGCSLNALGPSDPNTTTVPGVHLHAMAAKIAATNDIVHIIPFWLIALFVTAAAFVAAALGATVNGKMSLSWMIAGVVGIFGFTVLALMQNVWVPGSEMMIAVVASTGAGRTVRYVFFERRRRRVEDAFDHYLSPHIVAQLADEDAQLHLGGDNRDITVMFADLSGFTRLSTLVSAEDLVPIMNRHFEVIVGAVERTGGYVDKFIGDSVMAIWGAPTPDPDHARNAVLAAIRAVKDVAALQSDLSDDRTLAVKIGINTGTAVVGNIGSANRYNYTTLGETVNIAARLESVPSQYGCHIIIGEETARRVRRDILACEIDDIHVDGIDHPLKVFEPISDAASATEAERDYVSAYEDALLAFRQYDYANACSLWRNLQRPAGHSTHSDAAATPARIMAERAENLEDLGT